MPHPNRFFFQYFLSCPFFAHCFFCLHSNPKCMDNSPHSSDSPHLVLSASGCEPFLRFLHLTISGKDKYPHVYISSSVVYYKHLVYFPHAFIQCNKFPMALLYVKYGLVKGNDFVGALTRTVDAKMRSCGAGDGGLSLTKE